MHNTESLALWTNQKHKQVIKKSPSKLKIRSLQCITLFVFKVKKIRLFLKTDSIKQFFRDVSFMESSKWYSDDCIVLGILYILKSHWIVIYWNLLKMIISYMLLYIVFWNLRWVHSQPMAKKHMKLFTKTYLIENFIEK